MKLDIIVPHYREPWSICKFLFDTLALQRGIDFREIRMIFVNDGKSKECNLSLKSLEKTQLYPFDVDVYFKAHAGVSAARNYGLKQSDADYVMFCDCDDGFLNCWSLNRIFSEMREGFDVLVANFLEELPKDTGELTVIFQDNNPTFVHGKVFRREFLLERNLFFDEELTIHEDSYFNALAYTEAKFGGVFKTVKDPLYLWRWNTESVVRKNTKDFVLRTYDDVIKSRTRMCRQLKLRGFDDDYVIAVCVTVLDVFYDFQKPSFTDIANAEYIEKAERAFKAFWNEFKPVFFDCTNKRIAEIMRGVREKAYQDGMLYERFGLESWLKHIEHDV